MVNKRNENSSRDNNRLEPVPPVPVSATWPPPWLENCAVETTPPPATPVSAELAPWEGEPGESTAEQPALPIAPPPVSPSGPKCRRCGSRLSVDVPIHEGRSIRRDCRKCGRFVGFPVWYGQPSNN